MVNSPSTLAHIGTPRCRRQREWGAPAMDPHTLADAAAILRRIIDAVGAGQLEADSARGKRFLHRLEGAQKAWEHAADAP